MKKADALKASHEDTCDSRRVWIPGTNLQGSEIKTLCGVWLPAWEDGPDGPANARRWRWADDPLPTCAECQRIADEEDEEDEETSDVPPPTT